VGPTCNQVEPSSAALVAVSCCPCAVALRANRQTSTNRASLDAGRLAGSRTARAKFALLLREFRLSRRMSLRDLANAIHFNRSYISNVESGKKLPEETFVKLADRELGANGKLLSYWKLADEERSSESRMHRTLLSAAQESEFLAALDSEDVDSEPVGGAIERLAISYLNTPPAPMLAQAAQLRFAIVKTLKSRDRSEFLKAEYLISAGRLSGVLAYAALDLGASRDAWSHASAAFQCADRVGDSELRAWARGTQGLIARFDGSYEVSLNLVREGYEKYSGKGTSTPRLLCGEAQSLANIGDSAGANSALTLALESRGKIRGQDSLGGLFSFSEAKQRYYASSSLIWLDEHENARRAAHEASQAIGMWSKSPMAERSLDDEALAHIYWATALVKLDEVDGATAVLQPVFDLPPERRISWIAKRMQRIGDMLNTPRYSKSPVATDLRDEIYSYEAGDPAE
jgi:transcriptional regulator with XRE-family HTH domain